MGESGVCTMKMHLCKAGQNKDLFITFSATYSSAKQQDQWQHQGDIELSELHFLGTFLLLTPRTQMLKIIMNFGLSKVIMITNNTDIQKPTYNILG